MYINIEKYTVNEFEKSRERQEAKLDTIMAFMETLKNNYPPNVASSVNKKGMEQTERSDAMDIDNEDEKPKAVNLIIEKSNDEN